jgi:hypothetical protein
VNRQRKRAREYFFQYGTLFQSVVVNQDIVEPLGYFDFRRKDKIREKELNTGAVFHLEIGGGDFHQPGGLAGTGIAGYVEGVFYAADHKKAEIVVHGGFVAHVEGHFHQYGFDRAGEYAALFAFGGVADIAFDEREGRQEAQVEKFAYFQVGNDPEVEAGAGNGFHAGKGVVTDKIFGMINPEIALVVSQGNPEIVGFRLEVVVVEIGALVELGGSVGGQAAEEQQGDQERFQDLVALYMVHIPRVSRLYVGCW